MADGPRKGGASMMTMLSIILLLSMVGAGIGFAVGIFLQPNKEQASTETQVASASTDKAPGEDASSGTNIASTTDSGEAETAGEDQPADGNLKIVPIPTVVTTLAAPPGKWVRLEGAILAVPDSSEPPELLAERAGEQVLTYLRTVKLGQLQGPSGFLALRDDLNETVNSLSKGEVRGLLIHGFLVE